MRWVFDHPEEARLLGERGPRPPTVRCFSPQECGSRSSTVSIRFEASEAESESIRKHLGPVRGPGIAVRRQ